MNNMQKSMLGTAPQLIFLIFLKISNRLLQTHLLYLHNSLLIEVCRKLNFQYYRRENNFSLHIYHQRTKAKER